MIKNKSILGILVLINAGNYLVIVLIKSLDIFGEIKGGSERGCYFICLTKVSGWVWVLFYI